MNNNHGLTTSGFYWYLSDRSKSDPNNGVWTIVIYHAEDTVHPFEMLACDELFTLKDMLPGEFVGPLKPPGNE